MGREISSRGGRHWGPLPSLAQAAPVPICASCTLCSTTARTKPLMSASLRRPPSRFLRISSGSCSCWGANSGTPWFSPRVRSLGVVIAPDLPGCGVCLDASTWGPRPCARARATRLPSIVASKVAALCPHPSLPSRYGDPALPMRYSDPPCPRCRGRSRVPPCLAAALSEARSGRWTCTVTRGATGGTRGDPTNPRRSRGFPGLRGHWWVVPLPFSPCQRSTDRYGRGRTGVPKLY